MSCSRDAFTCTPQITCVRKILHQFHRTFLPNQLSPKLLSTTDCLCVYWSKTSVHKPSAHIRVAHFQTWETANGRCNGPKWLCVGPLPYLSQLPTWRRGKIARVLGWQKSGSGRMKLAAALCRAATLGGRNEDKQQDTQWKEQHQQQTAQQQNTTTSNDHGNARTATPEKH